MPVTIRDYVTNVVGLLAPQPGRVAFAARLALICALTVLLAEIYQTPEPALTAYIVFFLNREDRATSIVMNVVLLLVITVVIGLVIAAAMLVANDPMWRVVAMTVISFGVLFLASASKLRPLGAILAMIVAFGLDELGKVQVGELATRGFLYVWLFVAIPVAVSMVVNFLLAPPPRRLAERAIARRLWLAAAMLRTPDAGTRRSFNACLQQGSAQIQGWLGLAAREKTSHPDDLAALRQAVESTLALLSAIDVADSSKEAPLPGPLREYIAKTMEEMAAILSTGRYPVDIVWQPPDDDPLLFPLAEQVRLEIRDALVEFATAPGKAALAEEKKAAPPGEKQEAGGFFVPDAFTNPEHVQYAVKTTGAAMFCYVLYSLLDWQSIHTCFITVYIVALTTTAETVEKLTLRVLGALVGAAVGIGAIVFVVPSLTSIQALMALVFVGTLGAGYVAAGSPRISYAGFQIAFAFFLCVVQGSAPAFDMTIARDRVIGILLGNLVVYVLFTNLWPVSVAGRIDPAIAALLRSLGAVMRAANASTRRALAAKARAELSALEADIEIAQYERQAVRPSSAWLGSRRDAARQIGALNSSLLFSAEQDGETSARIATRLDALAGRFGGNEAEQPPPENNHPTRWSKRPLFDMIDARLRGLERAAS
jgi:multidrug resistance protein MdtO